MTKRIELTVSDETWERIETARGLIPRAAWIKSAVDSALDGLVVVPVAEATHKMIATTNTTVRLDDEQVEQIRRRQKPSLRDTWSR